MAIFVPYKPPLPLPQVGDGFEHATLDLKVRLDLTKTFHLAKDVAAFANHLGGTLIIGAKEKAARVDEYRGMSESDLKAAQDAISLSVAQRCSPRPVIDFGRYLMTTGHVLTVLVYPSVGQPIGVRAMSDATQGGYGGEAFAFPVRSGSDSVFLLPEQLPMYMMPEVRKIAIALSAIKEGEQIVVHPHSGRNPGAAYEPPFRVQFVGSDVLSNSLTFRHARASKAANDVSLPLEAIRSVWKSLNEWHIALKGGLAGDDSFIWRD